MMEANETQIRKVIDVLGKIATNEVNRFGFFLKENKILLDKCAEINKRIGELKNNRFAIIERIKELENNQTKTPQKEKLKLKSTI